MAMLIKKLNEASKGSHAISTANKTRMRRRNALVPNSIEYIQLNVFAKLHGTRRQGKIGESDDNDSIEMFENFIETNLTKRSEGESTPSA